MCRIPSPTGSSVAVAVPRNPPAEPGTCFSASQLNPTTFLIVEEDKWDENPFIYVKAYPSTLVIVDTGSGGIARDPGVKLTSLKEFLETCPLAVNENKPLNPGGFKSYTYKVTHWASDGQHVVDGAGEDLGLVIYQTPGHTPDELALWDPQERVLFAGDTIYEWYPILFPPEGDLVIYTETLGKLRSLVDEWNKETGKHHFPVGHDDRSLKLQQQHRQNLYHAV
ncbi:hypothetical protein G7Z17_g138 [Cylindrodendrum hubeiense]|uniref:Metallo-beta-lactamase domain-containing protein n=1 Tax=Cylindrodendrum hubeiense TaxID=595255 RepID=A0A9P5HQA8_9HYPO|nr:hypothetical protein G7Z17_g138 [Cylindrodendrum hubeiense]